MSEGGTVFDSKVMCLDVKFKNGWIVARCEAYPEMMIVARDWVDLAKNVEVAVWAMPVNQCSALGETPIWTGGCDVGRAR